MISIKPDPLDIFKIKSAESERERVSALEEAVEKAVNKAQINYLIVTLGVSVFLIITLQSLTVMNVIVIPVEVFLWIVSTMTIMLILPWQLRRFKALPQ